MNTYLSALLCLILGTSSLLCAEGKLDVGAVYLHLDVLQSGKVIDELDMKGERFDLTHHICAGFLLKGAFMHTTTGGKFQYGSVGLGYYIPLGDCFVCIPSGGYSYSRLKSKIDLHYGETLLRLEQKFTSEAPYAGIELIYQHNACISITGSFQYAWSENETHIESLPVSKGESKGPSYALILEYKTNPALAFNIAAGYNASMSHEKHGIKARGIRFGMGYYY